MKNKRTNQHDFLSILPILIFCLHVLYLYRIVDFPHPLGILKLIYLKSYFVLNLGTKNWKTSNEYDKGKEGVSRTIHESY
mgnify:CR=1 FL=1